MMGDVWLIKLPLECQRPGRQRKGEGRRVYGAPALLEPHTSNCLPMSLISPPQAS